MSIITVILILVAIGVIMWLVNTYIPMQDTIKKILNVFVVVAVIVWLINLFVDIGSLGSVHQYHTR